MPITPLLWRYGSQANTFDSPLGSTGSATQYDGQIVALDNGNYVVLWEDDSRVFQTAGYGISGQLFSATGAKIGGETSLDTFTGSGSQMFPAVASLPHSKFAVAYINQTGGSNFVDIETYDSNLNRLTFASPHSSANSITNTAITGFADGSYLVTYTATNSGTNTNIVGNIVHPDGTYSADIAIFADTDISDRSQVATLSNGNAVVVYDSQYLGSSTDYDALFDIVSPSGAIVKASTVVSGAGSTATEYDAHVAALKSGGFAVTWSDNGAGNYDVHASIYDNSGNIVASDITVNTTTAGDQYLSDVVALQNGFIASWYDVSSSSEHAQRFDDAGQKVGTEFTVSGSSGFASGDATLLSDGRVAFATTTYNGDYDVYHSIYAVNDPTPTDFNGDTNSDILFQRSDGSIAVWQMDGMDYNWSGLVGASPGASWKAVTTADFGGDHRADILWQNSDGTPMIWQMNGNQVQSSTTLFNPGADWHPAATGDFNGDGMADILWQNPNGSTVIWFMNGATITSNSGILFNPGASWKAVATGDFNADGHADILWQNSNGTPVIWEMNGGTILSNSGNLINPGASWKIVNTGDFNGDGHSDILFQNTSTNGLALWEMNGTTIVSRPPISTNPGAGWNAAETGDFNHDGKSDIVMHNDNGQVAIWEMDGANIQHLDINGYNPGSAWHIV
jgi:hypothetical protein